MYALFVQMLRFGLVGFLNAGVDAAIFFLALHTVTNSLVVANFCAWVVAVTCSYFLNSKFTFAGPDRRPFGLRDYLMFVATQIGGFLAHTAMLVASAPHVPLWFAKLLGIGVGFVVNFTLARAIVFRSR